MHSPQHSPFSSGACAPAVSVIIPVYQDQEGLERALTGLANQKTQRPFEVLVVDNDSQPAMRIPEPLTGQLSVQSIVCRRKGSYAARNEGMKCAEGRVIAFLDADCVPDEGWIESGCMALEKLGCSSLVGGEVRLSVPEHPTAVSRYQCAMGFRQRENIQQNGFSATANLWLPAKIVGEIGPFREDLLSGGDREWALRAQSHGYLTHYAAEVAVSTTPRLTLSSAIRQARRVAGGRHQIRDEKLDTEVAGLSVTYDKPSMLSRFITLCCQGGKISDNAGVIFVAGILWLATQIERLRLKLGSNPERR